MTPDSKLTWMHNCHCGKLFRDHHHQDLHDCELTGEENQRGLITRRMVYPND